MLVHTPMPCSLPQQSGWAVLVQSASALHGAAHSQRADAGPPQKHCQPSGHAVGFSLQSIGPPPAPPGPALIDPVDVAAPPVPDAPPDPPAPVAAPLPVAVPVPAADAPPEALPLEVALAAYTSGSAWVCHRDDAGAVVPGAVADLVLLDRDPFDAPDSVGVARVERVWVGGEPIVGG